MATKNYFKDMAIAQAPKQGKIVDAITEEAPLLEMLPMQAASNGIQNVYENLKEIDGAQVVDLDSELPIINAEGDLVYEDLAALGGIIQVGEDKAKKMGGAASYFAKKMPAIFRETSANTEKSIIYNNFLPFAKANSRQELAGGTDADVQTSMFCVNWVPEEITGLFDPTGFGNGKLFDILALNGGNAHLITSTDTEGNDSQITGYATRIKTYIGIQLANPRYVASIRNIDLASDPASDTGFEALPTESQIDNMIENARATSANGFIYMHPRTLSALNVYKGGALQMTPSDQDFNRTISNWNGIRIITSRNFSLTEAIATN